MASIRLLSLFLICGMDVAECLPWGLAVSWEGRTVKGSLGSSSGCCRDTAVKALDPHAASHTGHSALPLSSSHPHHKPT